MVDSKENYRFDLGVKGLDAKQTSIIIIFGGLMQLLMARELIMMMNKGIVDCKNI